MCYVLALALILYGFVANHDIKERYIKSLEHFRQWTVSVTGQFAHDYWFCSLKSYTVNHGI